MPGHDNFPLILIYFYLPSIAYGQFYYFENRIMYVKKICKVLLNTWDFIVRNNDNHIIFVTNDFKYVYILSHFRHLDPFGTSVNYLDSAFRNIRNLGIVSVTSTDISSLYAKAQHVARRHYGCNIVRTEYYKELAARIVVAAVARYRIANRVTPNVWAYVKNRFKKCFSHFLKYAQNANSVFHIYNLPLFCDLMLYLLNFDLKACV